MDNTETQRIISFCTGYGGIELGLELIGLDFRTVVYVEIEAFAVANLVAKIEENKLAPAPVWTNLKTFPAEMFRGKVHGIIGGYPCQPFSCAGQRKGTEDPRHLWPYIEKHIRAIRPVWCLFENVPGHLAIGLDVVVKSLQDMGYRVEAGIFSAEEVGLPHQRKRVFILAVTECLGWGRGNRLAFNFRGETSDRPENKIEGSGSHEELVHSSKLRLQGLQKCRERRRKSDAPSELGNSANEGLEGSCKSKQQKQLQNAQRGSCEKLADNSNKGQFQGNKYQTRSVARPGEEQYDWEEPRTVEPGMGRTIDGFASRIDELRLLGNGVVPRTAGLAFMALWDKMNGGK